MSGKKRITLISLGGTIAMTGKSGQQVVPTLSAQNLISQIPELNQIAEIGVVEFTPQPSCSLGFRLLCEVADVINDLARQGQDGFVITQGTDTIEESAFFLDLILSIDQPVVMTGAMRNASQAGPDGAANLLCAFKVAAAKSSRNMGVCVVFDQLIHLARFVYKSDSICGHAFRSSFRGPVGRVVEDRLVYFSSLHRHYPALAYDPDHSQNVELYCAVLDPAEGTVSRFAETSTDGLVVAAMGGGHVPAKLVGELERLAQKMPVILASRITGGQVLKHTYGYAGGEVDLLARGLISAGWLDALKARILLSLLLSQQVGDQEIRNWFIYFDGG